LILISSAQHWAIFRCTYGTYVARRGQPRPGSDGPLPLQQLHAGEAITWPVAPPRSASSRHSASVGLWRRCR